MSSCGNSVVYTSGFIAQELSAGYFARDNGTLNRSNTDVVEKVIFWWPLHNIEAVGSL